VTRRPTPLTLG